MPAAPRDVARGDFVVVVAGVGVGDPAVEWRRFGRPRRRRGGCVDEIAKGARRHRFGVCARRQGGGGRAGHGAAAVDAWPRRAPAFASPTPPGGKALSGGGSTGGGSSSFGGGASGDEEAVAATLACAAVMIAHTARLLSVTLRYPMRLCGSRSTIEDPYLATHASAARPGGGGGARAPAALPLYTKGTEPRMVQHALALLCRNAQQLLIAAGEECPTPPPKILPALHALLVRLHSATAPPLSRLMHPSPAVAAAAPPGQPALLSPGGAPATTPATPATTPATPATPTSTDSGRVGATASVVNLS